MGANIWREYMGANIWREYMVGNIWADAVKRGVAMHNRIPGLIRYVSPLMP
jgi:hypothetical protein